MLLLVFVEMEGSRTLTPAAPQGCKSWWAHKLRVLDLKNRSLEMGIMDPEKKNKIKRI